MLDGLQFGVYNVCPVTFATYFLTSLVHQTAEGDEPWVQVRGWVL